MDNNTLNDKVQIFTNDGVKRLNELYERLNREAANGFGQDLQQAQEAVYAETYRQLKIIGEYIARIAEPIKDQGGDHEYDGAIQHVWQGLHQGRGIEPHGICMLDAFSTGCDLGEGSGGDISDLPEQKLGRKSFSSSLRLKVYKRDSYKCVYCNSSEDLSLDHIHPVSMGGSNDEDNLQTLCMPCNRTKSARPDSFMRQALGI